MTSTTAPFKFSLYTYLVVALGGIVGFVGHVPWLLYGCAFIAFLCVVLSVRHALWVVRNAPYRDPL